MIVRKMCGFFVLSFFVLISSLIMEHVGLY